jgi:dolichol-phosphate mannosyltransferase
MLDLTVVVPIFNEQDNVEPLLAQLFAVLDGLVAERGLTFEVIAINDGSTDGSLARLKTAAGRRRELKVVDIRRNSGQTAAIMAGIDFAAGGIIVSIDGDLQNDPADIPRLLEELDRGFDVVSGWRRHREDAPIRRNLVSRIANRVISDISGVRFNDYGAR